MRLTCIPIVFGIPLTGLKRQLCGLLMHESVRKAVKMHHEAISLRNVYNYNVDTPSSSQV